MLYIGGGDGEVAGTHIGAHDHTDARATPYARAPVHHKDHGFWGAHIRHVRFAPGITGGAGPTSGKVGSTRESRGARGPPPA